MGKGDRRTRRGKLFRGTFGASRKHKLTKSTAAATAATAAATAAAGAGDKASEAVAAPKKKAPRKKKAE